MVDEDTLSGVLSEFARTVITDFPIQGILDHLVERIVSVLPITAAGVTLICADAQPEYIAASDASALRFEQLQTDIGEGPCLAAHESCAAVSVADLAHDERFPLFSPAAVAAGLAAVFAFPLRSGHESIGALDLYRTSPGPLDVNDMDAAQTLADVTTAYLLNARAREEARAASNAFHHNSLHDPLTGLPNRQLLEERLSHAAELAERAHTNAAVLFIDLDRFKDVNDRYGHHVGDALLIAFTERLSRLVRACDTLARVSGDEFVVFCEQINSPDDVEKLATRIAESLKAPFLVDGHSLGITASVGIAYAGPGEAITDQLIVNADKAMYEVKHRGGAGHRMVDLRHTWSPATYDAFEADLRRALDLNELEVAYQPILRPRDRVVVGVEALLRWSHLTRGRIDPPAIIAVAERSELINQIGEWVLRRACSDHRRWRHEHPGTDLDLSVNVSVRQLLQPAFPTIVADALATSGTRPTTLVIEVTENIFIDDNNGVCRVLDQLGRSGVRIALDDYGTGFSSLNYLAHLPIHILKIDRCFISDVTRNAGRIIVASVNQLAHDLGLQVTAEGVETEIQHEIVNALGCDLVQGYLYAMPMTADEVGSLLSPVGTLTVKAP